MTAPQFETFEVRPHLLRSEEPFALIRARVDTLSPVQGLIVIAPFLWTPLIEPLQSERFRSTAECRQDSAWMVNFWRD